MNNMENRLKSLIGMNKEENRRQIALKWKEGGGKIIGMIDAYVPQEIIQAAGMLPWRMAGVWRDSVPRATVYRPLVTCRFSTHILEAVLSGELSFLDGVVCTNRDDDIRRLWDVIDYTGNYEFSHIMHLPHMDSATGKAAFQRSVNLFKEKLEKQFKISIADEAISEAIVTLNNTRQLFAEIYELRKLPKPPLTGAEVLGLTTAAGIMPREEFNKELDELLPYIKERDIQIKNTRPRILVTGDMLDDPRYLEIVENAGSLVAMDDLDTGSRWLLGKVEQLNSKPVEAIVDYYLSDKPQCPRMWEWKKELDMLKSWIKEYSIDGVIELLPLYSFPIEFRTRYLQDTLNDAGIPNISIKREYHLANAGQLSTRVGAFIEMLGSGYSA